ncbi:hypothetical protein BC826DRAFT_165923 [Russula brevipes]|nr:hypothetical protein BC826DRAFT_165923 [Russula brevipes]
MSVSSMITLPPSSANGLYSCYNARPRVASPASSYTLSPAVSPPGSPSLMLTIPVGSTNGLYSLRQQHYAEITSPTGSGSLSPPPMSRPSSPLPTINELFSPRTSWPMSLSLSDRPNSDSDSPSTNLTNSVSYAYTVRSINSRKSRLAVLYPRPVRLQRMSGVESIPESALASLESLVPLSSRPVSISMSLQDNVNPFGDNKVSLSRS